MDFTVSGPSRATYRDKVFTGDLCETSSIAG